MPGLVAILSPTAREPIDRSLFRRMSSALEHRDWYGVDTHVSEDGRAAIARVHLGTVHPEPQPHVLADGRVRIFLHGEIYNDETTPADALSFVARAYERYGRDFAARLNGSFLILVVDDRRGEMLVATDRTASRPAFYVLDGGALYVASEVKALLAVPGLRRKLDLAALGSFLSCGHLLDGRTFVEDVHRLGHATVATFDGSGLHLHEYWHRSFDAGAKDLGTVHYQRTLADLLRTAVRRRTRTKHAYGILLSGGYDSRAILGCHLENTPPEQVQTISWGQREDVPFSDCWVAARLAQKLGVRHAFFTLEAASFPRHVADFVRLSDGLTDGCFNYPESLRLFQRIREELGVEVLLRGDECFGYTSRWRLRSLVDVDSARTLMRPDAYELLSDLSADVIREVHRRCTLTDPQDRRDVFYLEQRVTQRLHPWSAVKAIELEVRTPYLDNDILDFLTTLPPAYRLDRDLWRRTVVSEFPALYGEFALHSNDIDWYGELSGSEGLRRYVLAELERSPLVSSLVDPAVLKKTLQAVRPRRQRLKQLAVAALGRHPAFYEALKGNYKGLTDGRRPLGAGRHKTLLFRLLTLALWERTFVPEGIETGLPR